MNRIQLFEQTKHQILLNKRSHLIQHLRQLEHNLTKSKNDNNQLKTQILEMRKSVQGTQRQSLCEEQKYYQKQEIHRLNRLEELKSIIEQYKFLCNEAIGYKQINGTEKQILTQDQNENTLNIVHTPNRSPKVVKTHLFCNHCQRNFLPQQYYRHCQQMHPDITGYRTLRN